MLHSFDTSKQTTVSADASLKGLGAVLRQDNKPVMFASRSLTDAETRYSQIERELMATVFALERFHHYVAGDRVLVETDHAPLLGLLKKPMFDQSLRLQKLRMRLLRYDFELKYVPGKLLGLPDVLSRAPLPYKADQKEIEFQTHMEKLTICENEFYNVTDRLLQIIFQAQQDDKTLQQVVQLVQNRWPKHKRDLPSDVAVYWYGHEQWEMRGPLLTFGGKIFVPKVARNVILKALHIGHIAAETMKRRARDTFYWPTLEHDAEIFQHACHTCAENAPAHPSAPLLPYPVPARPWQMCAADFAEHKGQQWLIIIDRFSKFIEAIPVSSTSSLAVRNTLSQMFARYGKPDVFLTDNATCFTARETQTFFENWEVKHVTSSPEYPRSNGLAESAVKIVKRLLKTSNNNDEFFQALMTQRMTNSRDLKAPAVINFARDVKTCLPNKLNLYDANKIVIETKIALDKRNDVYKEKHDKHCRSNPRFSKGQPVWANINGKVQAGVLEEQDTNPRSWNVRLNDGSSYRRNEAHLAKRTSCYMATENSTTAEKGDESRKEKTNPERYQQRQQQQPETNIPTTNQPIPEENPEIKQQQQRQQPHEQSEEPLLAHNRRQQPLRRCGPPDRYGLAYEH
jgi:transposase InsO family protein